MQTGFKLLSFAATVHADVASAPHAFVPILLRLLVLGSLEPVLTGALRY